MTTSSFQKARAASARQHKASAAKPDVKAKFPPKAAKPFGKKRK